MNGTKAVELHKIFKRHKFTDQETKTIIDAVDRKTDVDLIKKDVAWIKWILGGLVALVIGLWADTKADIREIRASMEQMKADMSKMQADIKELNKKTDLVIQKLK